ncbi:hypothetical protein P153DRAFT_399102 [Dothidotthia symphoricarpi CBS 119687]|uniref:NAD(P)-binding protein n=1 Tax=Dothidotthia symphoricarpi CBS 119687 TaxID=1392245 RepID=A0A6A6A892_9PLEO|nr:uncharacterized protein P153DRAFT_399102 [Dothidotthia symphoricarpi CBS 119687]KAF2127028.1 hypothetical protein P153DRAFT_399102 [Dothidotthia symphoricarpi CBS 119687]
MFPGELMHSAHYEEGCSLTNKHVAVTAAGSLGAQIVAAIQYQVKHIYHWAGKNVADNRYSDKQRRFLVEDPNKYLEHRKQIEKELNQGFRFIIKGSEEAQLAREYADKACAKSSQVIPSLLRR